MEPAPRGPGTASGVAASRAAAYAQLLDPVLAILGCAPGSAAPTQLLRALLRTTDPSGLARGVASELDEEVFATIRKCWVMSMRVFRATPRSEDGVYHAAMMLLEEVWNAAAEARAVACEPELSLLKRLMNAWSAEERAALLRPAEAAQALTSHGGLFFSLLDQEWQRCAQQDSWGDSFLEGEKARRLAKLADIRCEARQRAADV
ncbi:hypothetical protein ABPG75_006105 [Micractinium tetrahymenae]